MTRRLSHCLRQRGACGNLFDKAAVRLNSLLITGVCTVERQCHPRSVGARLGDRMYALVMMFPAGQPSKRAYSWIAAWRRVRISHELVLARRSRAGCGPCPRIDGRDTAITRPRTTVRTHQNPILILTIKPPCRHFPAIHAVGKSQSYNPA